MTAMLFVKDYLKEQTKFDDLHLMFDADNPTNEEEILQEGLMQVYVK